MLRCIEYMIEHCLIAATVVVTTRSLFDKRVLHCTHHSPSLTLLSLYLLQLWMKATPGGLILEVVALRDIQPGEELYMDYGHDWEEAWNKHVQEWKPVKGAFDYVYPEEMDETAPLRTVKEQETDPYPSNLMTVCSTPDESRKKYHIVEWYERYEFPFRMAVCHIINRKVDEHGDLVYDVMLDWDGNGYKNVPKKDQYVDLNVPRRAIRFVDKPNLSDQRKFVLV